MSHNTTRLALAAAVMMFTLVAWPSAKAVAQGLSTAPDRNTKAAKVGSLDWRNTSVPVSSRTTVLFVEGVGRANNLLYKVREVSVGDLMASPGKEAVLALDYQCDNWNECGQVTGSTIVVVGISNSKLDDYVPGRGQSGYRRAEHIHAAPRYRREGCPQGEHPVPFRYDRHVGGRRYTRPHADRRAVLRQPDMDDGVHAYNFAEPSHPVRFEGHHARTGRALPSSTARVRQLQRHVLDAG